jgi:hypothetical protein
MTANGSVYALYHWRDLLLIWNQFQSWGADQQKMNCANFQSFLYQIYINTPKILIIIQTRFGYCQRLLE